MLSNKARAGFSSTAVAIVSFSIASPALADTQTAAADAQILQPIQFAVLLEMDFGKIVSSGAAGVVHMDPSNTQRDCDPSISCLGTFAFSQLELTGSDANVVVNYDPSFNLTGPGAPMLVEPEFPGGQGANVQLTGGSAVFVFGAKLYVNANQAPGSYSGTFSVDVNYQ